MPAPSEHSFQQPVNTTMDIVGWGKSPFDDDGLQFRVENADGLPVLLVSMYPNDPDRMWRQLAAIPQVAERLRPRCAVMRCVQLGTVEVVHLDRRLYVCSLHERLTRLGEVLTGATVEVGR